MSSPSFPERLRTSQAEHDSVVCVGLDPDPARLPAVLRDTYALPEAVARFNAAIVAATRSAACAYKLNLAFYEALGRDGWSVLEQTLAQIPDTHLTIADGKRADIGNSARFYARAVFDELGFDACTVAPYMGRDSVLPFLERPGTAAFVLARTSNPGAADFQEACTCTDGTPLYVRVAEEAAAWSAASDGTAGLVAGATDAASLATLRARCPSLPFLIPGVGAQGGDARAVMRAAATDAGRVLVNSSRSILFASPENDFAEAAGQAAHALRETLNNAREAA